MLKNKEILRLLLVSAIFSIILAVASYLILINSDERTWHAYLFNFLYFVSAAAGLTTLPAIILVSNGKWTKGFEKICFTGLSFSIPSLIAIIILWLGSNQWAPWINSEEHKFWLQNNFVFDRNFLLLALFWFLAFLFIIKIKSDKKIVFAGWLVFIYSITFSVMGFDFIMALDPKWHSLMTGGYFFITGLYLATSAWAIIVIFFSKTNDDVLYDIGRLMIMFCMLTSYTMFSQLLPIWYENLPDENRFIIPMLNLAWKPVSYLLLVIIYLGPLFLLLPRTFKRKPYYMAFISLMILAGLWIEKWWLVSAVFEKNRIIFGWQEVIFLLIFLMVLLPAMYFSAREAPKLKRLQDLKD
jgi:hypothetical protein